MERMVLVLKPDPAQQNALEALLDAQQDPDSPFYHQWLTPEHFGELFGISDSDLQQVLQWLEDKGSQLNAFPQGEAQCCLAERPCRWNRRFTPRFTSTIREARSIMPMQPILRLRTR
jgi:hypothetical protein